jgi:hypothetical protein
LRSVSVLLQDRRHHKLSVAEINPIGTQIRDKSFFYFGWVGGCK